MTHPSSPVFSLAREISGSAFQLVPEKAEELHARLKDVQLVLSTDDGNFEFRASPGKIVASVGALNLLWCASYSYWFFYQAFVQAQRTGSTHVQFTDNATSEAARLYVWALRCVHDETVEQWPESAPKPSADVQEATLAVINELFLVATGWIMLHESGHIILEHPVAMLPRAIAEENEADRFATDYVLTNISDPAVLLKRALGVAVANIVLVTIDLMRGTFDSKFYPPAYERLHRNLRHRELADEHPVHAFADALLQVHLSVFGVPHEVNLDSRFDSILDDLCFALSRKGK